MKHFPLVHLDLREPEELNKETHVAAVQKSNGRINKVRMYVLHTYVHVHIHTSIIQCTDITTDLTCLKCEIVRHAI